jgi:hypothetical protein
VTFFREVEPGIFVSTGVLGTEEDGPPWTQDYHGLLARGVSFTAIANVKDRPHQDVGKHMIMWMKAHKARTHPSCEVSPSSLPRTQLTALN